MLIETYKRQSSSGTYNLKSYFTDTLIISNRFTLKQQEKKMMLKEERTTPHAIAFSVDLNAAPGISPGESEPEIKKRLEAYSLQGGEDLSREAIAEKLKRAEEKRQQALSNRGGAISPRIAEERRKAALERKRVMDQENLSQIKESQEKINLADDKRKQTAEERRQKLRQHIAKVEERCRE